ncbi:17196_t:CDS:2, partial [Cetraspora pellucida]
KINKKMIIQNEKESVYEKMKEKHKKLMNKNERKTQEFDPKKYDVITEKLFRCLSFLNKKSIYIFEENENKRLDRLVEAYFKISNSDFLKVLQFLDNKGQNNKNLQNEINKLKNENDELQNKIKEQEGIYQELENVKKQAEECLNTIKINYDKDATLEQKMNDIINFCKESIQKPLFRAFNKKVFCTKFYKISKTPKYEPVHKPKEARLKAAKRTRPDRIRAQKEELEKLRKEIFQLKKENDDLKKKLKKCKEKKEKKNNDLKKKLEECKDEKEKKDCLKENKKNLSKEDYKNLQEENKTLKENLEKLNIEIIKLSKEIDETKKEIKEYCILLNEKVDKILNNFIVEYNNNIETFDKILNNFIVEYNNDIETFDSKFDKIVTVKLKEENKIAQQQNDRLNVEYQKTVEWIRENRKTYSDKKFYYGVISQKLDTILLIFNTKDVYMLDFINSIICLFNNATKNLE